MRYGIFRDFLSVRPVKEWLRLRSENGKYSITYKNWHYQKDGRSYHADEYESVIDNIKGLKKLFKALDFNTLTTVNKIRKTWIYKDYEISLDTVENLGDFVEIEFKGESQNPDHKKISVEMVEFLRKLDCGKIKKNNGGYPFLLLFPEETKYEEV